MGLRGFAGLISGSCKTGYVTRLLPLVLALLIICYCFRKLSRKPASNKVKGAMIASLIMQRHEARRLAGRTSCGKIDECDFSTGSILCGMR